MSQPEDKNTVSFDRVAFECYSEAFARAEAAIKFSERVSGDASLPAVNQLRYAAKHVTEGNLQSAMQHCLRARYDAYEAAIIFLLKFYAEFDSRHYTSETLNRYLPNWKEYRQLFLKDRDAIVRMHPLREFADSDFDALDKVLEELSSMRDEIDRIYPEIDSDLARLEEEDRVRRERERQDREDARAREDRRRYILSLWWTMCGTILGALGIILTIFK